MEQAQESALILGKVLWMLFSIFGLFSIWGVCAFLVGLVLKESR
jgi:hypothetical protein